jgi:serine/threonine protein kinase
MLAEVPTLLGHEFAGYHLAAILGQGGMSTVYCGRRRDADDPDVALKVLQVSPDMPRGRVTFHTRFRREAQIVSSLAHDHIMPVLEFGEWQDMPYMVMPLAIGGTLTSHLAAMSGPTLLADASAFVSQLASALDYAHAHGIVHRDVKPSNALLNEQGQLLLADFGIARMYSGAASQRQATTLTSAGEIVGTPSYMAPEQFERQEVSPAADIYALGVVLYLLTTGRLPVEGETPLAIGTAHLHARPVSPQWFRSDLPVPAAAAILCALEKDPTRRFASAGALADAFAAGIQGYWTAENCELASPRSGNQTPTTPNTVVGHRPFQGSASPRYTLRKGLATLAIGALVTAGVATAQVTQHRGLLSLISNFQSSVVGVSGSERGPAAPTSDASAVVIGYDGAQVYALWPEGTRRWTLWTDGTVVSPPQLNGNIVSVTTVKGTRYSIRASDGAVLTRVLATPTPSAGNGDQNGHGNKGYGEGGHGGNGNSNGDGGDK